MKQTFLSRLGWRFATKKFDPEKKVPRETLEKILEAARMAPSSYGVQPFHIYVISNPEVRAKLKAVSYNQAQVTESSHLLVFAARTDLTARVNEQIEAMSAGDEKAKAGLEDTKKTILEGVSGMDEKEAFSWASRQAYIALGFALAAAAELEVDSCPMEGFSPAEVDKVLGLPANQKSCVYLALGYRKEGPVWPKFRFPKSDIFTMLE